MLSESAIKRSPNLRSKANIFSIFAFTYTFPLFLKGFREDLDETDITAPSDKCSSEKLGEKLEKFWLEETFKRKPSLTRAISRAFGKQCIFFWSISLFVDMVLRTAIPICLLYLIASHERMDKDTPTNYSYVYIGVLIGVSFLIVVLRHFQAYNTLLCGQNMRIACCSLVYRKILKLSKISLVSISTGQITNLLSNDVARFDEVVAYSHSLLVGPLQVVLHSYLLYTSFGMASLTGVFLMILLAPLQVFFGKMASHYRFRTAVKTDERISIMNEMVVGMLAIKMYALEKPLAQLVSLVRRAEVQKIRYASYINGYISIFSVVVKFATSVSILTYSIFGNKVSAEYAFFVTAMYLNLREAMSIFIPRAFALIGESKMSLQRLQRFLMLEEIEGKDLEQMCEIIGKNNISVIRIKNVTSKWNKNSSVKILENINLDISGSCVIAIIGPVGGGKTTILNIILNEVPVIEGKVDVSGKVSYASQEPWIFDGTLKQNILFGQSLNSKRYHAVIKACALENDMEQLPKGDATLVGERGVMLSGGNVQGLI